MDNISSSSVIPSSPAYFLCFPHSVGHCRRLVARVSFQTLPTKLHVCICKILWALIRLDCPLTFPPFNLNSYLRHLTQEEINGHNSSTFASVGFNFQLEQENLGDFGLCLNTFKWLQEVLSFQINRKIDEGKFSY